MKDLRKELIDFIEFTCETGLCKKQDALTYEIIVNEYLKSINYELSEPEADGCNKQANEICGTCEHKDKLLSEFPCSGCNEYDNYEQID